jgi:hypothetical protein
MKALKLATLTILFGLAAAPGYADHTNVVQNLSLQLFGVSQGGTFTNRGFVITSAEVARLDTRRVIAALGTATMNSFSSTSRLVVVTPLGGGASAFQVRDGGNAVEVTGFFTWEQLSDTVQDSFLNTRTGRSFSTDYSIQRLALHDAEGYPALTLSFDVRGFATMSSSNGGQTSEARIEAAGTGNRGDDLLIIQGTLNVRGRTLEVVPDDGGNNGGGNET